MGMFSRMVNFFTVGRDAFEPIEAREFLRPEDMKDFCKVIGSDYEEMKARDPRAAKELGETEALLELMQSPDKTDCLVGQYSQADRFLWVAVCMGFPSIVKMALDKGADAKRSYRCRNSDDDDDAMEVDLLFLADLKGEDEIATHRQSLSENRLLCCDAARAWDARVGDTFNGEAMNGAAVADILVKAGADPLRQTIVLTLRAGSYVLPVVTLWQAVGAMPHLGALARNRALNVRLPLAGTAPAAKVRL